MEKTWDQFERERLAIQAFSPRFSRAELCRRAGISDTTMLKGLKAKTPPRPSKRAAVTNELKAERERLTIDQRQLLELALAGERAAIEGGLRS